MADSMGMALETYIEQFYMEKFVDITKNRKTKICELCKKPETTMYRVQIAKGKLWIFVCTKCCIEVKSLEHYRYGGTWKG
jgi:hypothetical protein